VAPYRSPACVHVTQPYQGRAAHLPSVTVTVIVSILWNGSRWLRYRRHARARLLSWKSRLFGFGAMSAIAHPLGKVDRPASHYPHASPLRLLIRTSARPRSTPAISFLAYSGGVDGALSPASEDQAVCWRKCGAVDRSCWPLVLRSEVLDLAEKGARITCVSTSCGNCIFYPRTMTSSLARAAAV
jgi:hypothetical protein